MAAEQNSIQANGLAGLRLAAGLAQGLALYLLYSAFDAKSWPATNGEIFAPLLLLSGFLPLIVIQGYGNLRTSTLLIWTIVAAAMIAALAWYDIWRAWPVDYVWAPKFQTGHVFVPGEDMNNNYVSAPHILPTFALCFFLGAALFIAHALVSGGDLDRRFMATYPTHFDVAWKLGVQVALAFAFVGAFWLVLWLGASLFNLIKLDFFERLIEHRWFSIPATALATALSFHISDVRAGLVRGIRTLALVLLSWLLPLMTLIGGGFLASLLFTGLAPLWATRHATALLLIAAAVLIVLINTAYQDGDGERRANAFFALAIRAASLLLFPIVILAGYALWLRVQQYGWTVERIESAAAIVVASGYALSYTANAVSPTLRLIEVWNFIAALVILTVLGAIFTPVADPARISVNDQVARLQSGKAPQAKFDLAYLRWNGGRFGRDALERLAKEWPSLRKSAQNQLAARTQYQALRKQPDDIERSLLVFPLGKTLPKDFVASAQKQQSGLTSVGVSIPYYCLTYTNGCSAVLLDFDGDGTDEVLLGQGVQRAIFHRDSDGEWRAVATVQIPDNCFPIADALRKGSVQWANPEPPKWRALQFGTVRLSPETIGPAISCPK